MSDLIVVFDVGTTVSRTIIFDIDGKEIVRAYEEYPLEKQPVGISEQEPMIWWNAVKNTCNIAVKKVNPDAMAYIGIKINVYLGDLFPKNNKTINGIRNQIKNK